jgi:5-methyltetrahydrofolate--homocysteine methyltransferase
MPRERRCVYDPLAELIAYYGQQEFVVKPTGIEAAAPVEERLKERIVRGDRLGLERVLDEALQHYTA